MASPRLRYVILRHEGIADTHFDLMFETAEGSPLQTWRSPCWPILEPTPLERLADHRAAYLTLEGALSGGRGHVHRVEGGNYERTEGEISRLVLRPSGSTMSTQLYLSYAAPSRWHIRPI